MAILVSCKLYVISLGANISFNVFSLYQQYLQFYLQHLCCGDSNIIMSFILFFVIFSHSVTLFNSCSVVLASLWLVVYAPHNVVSSAYAMKLNCEVDNAIS